MRGAAVKPMGADQPLHGLTPLRVLCEVVDAECSEVKRSGEIDKGLQAGTDFSSLVAVANNG